jgi:hypothetical protein
VQARMIVESIHNRSGQLFVLTMNQCGTGF